MYDNKREETKFLFRQLYSAQGIVDKINNLENI